MTGVYSAHVYLYLTLVFLHLSVFILRSSVSAKLERFKFYLGSEKHLSPPYLWIIERFSGIQYFIESTPLRFYSIVPLFTPLLLLYIILSQRLHKIHASHIHEYIHTCINMHTIPPFLNPSLLPSLTQESWLSRDSRVGWLVLHQPSTNHSTPLAPVLPFASLLSPYTPPPPLLPSVLLILFLLFALFPSFACATSWAWQDPRLPWVLLD